MNAEIMKLQQKNQVLKDDIQKQKLEFAKEEANINQKMNFSINE